jgi:hypothetical protein
MVDNATIQRWILKFAPIIVDITHHRLNSGYKKERNLFKVKRMEKILILQEPVIAK